MAKPQIITVQPPPVIVKVIAQPPEHRPWFNDPEWINAYATIGLFLVTTALVVVTGLLWLFTARMWRETKRSGDAAAQALKIAFDSYTAEHQPELEPVLFFVSNGDRRTVGDAEFEVSIYNGGNSPAIIKGIVVRVTADPGKFNFYPEKIVETFEYEFTSDMSSGLESGSSPIKATFSCPAGLRRVMVDNEQPCKTSAEVIISFKDASGRSKTADYSTFYNKHERRFETPKLLRIVAA